MKTEDRDREGGRESRMGRKFLILLALCISIGTALADGTWYCRQCGTDVTGPACPTCGGTKETSGLADGEWVCVCGRVNKGNFCGRCGTSFEAAAVARAPETEAPAPEADPGAIARSSFDLCIKDPATGQRIVRSRETNLGDLCADAYRAATGADVAFVNSGGIRADIPAGSITEDRIYMMHPFGNKLCMVRVTGLQILNCLEWSSRRIPEESGGFLQVSGLSCEIHTYIASSAIEDENGMFAGLTGSGYRVRNVTIGGEPLDLWKTYTVATSGYIVKDLGDGFAMFREAQLVLDDIMLDKDAVAVYLSRMPHGEVPAEYSDPYGRGRITIVEKDPAAQP